MSEPLIVKRLKLIGEALAVVGGVTTLFGVAVATYSYLADRYIRLPEPIVGYPTVMELRCSSEDFDPAACTYKEGDGFLGHLSVTAAFPITVAGAPIHSVRFNSARAIVELTLANGHQPNPPYTLKSYWGVKLTGGERSDREQLTALTVHGGESLSREIWFMPVPEPCAQDLLQRGKCTPDVERRNFKSWRDLIAGIKKTIDDIGSTENADRSRLIGKVTFIFEWILPRLRASLLPPFVSSAEVLLEKQRSCNFQLGPTVAEAVTNYETTHPLYVLIVCEPDKVTDKIFDDKSDAEPRVP